MNLARHWLAALTVALVVAGPALAEDDDWVRTVTVQGTGEAAAKPDIARINVGVVTEEKSAAEALAANSTAMTALFGVLVRFKIADRDRQTSNFNVSPRYDRPGREGGVPEIGGYQVSNQVSVRVRDLDRLGELLDAVVTGGANQLHGIAFSVDDPSKALDQARKAAIGDARRRAELYADAVGLALGKVLEISEEQVRAPRPEYAAPRLAAARAVPVAAGEQEFGATVTVVFELVE